MESLKKLTTPTGTVIRGGSERVIPSKDIVIGDLLPLKMGDKIPADVRLIETMNLEVDESALTGESIAAPKHADRICDTDEADKNPAERFNIAFSTCAITKGRAMGVVSATGMATAVGNIYAMLGTKAKVRKPKTKKNGDPPGPIQKTAAWSWTALDWIGSFLGISGDKHTPLQKRLAILAYILLGVAIIFFVVVLGVNLWSTDRDVLIYGVGTGLSMMPASLPVVMVITLAAATAAMKKREVIVRVAKSLEALGAVTSKIFFLLFEKFFAWLHF